MSSVNKVILVGNLTRDPKTHSFSNGGRVCNFSIATNESWKDKNTGEKKERAEFHTVAIFNENLVTVAEKYLRKGSKVYVEGQLETRKWQDQSGNDRYSTEVVLRPFRSELVLLGDMQASRPGSDVDNTPAGGGGMPEEDVPFMMEWR